MKPCAKRIFLLFLSLALLLSACDTCPAAFAREAPAAAETAVASETCAQAFFRQITTRLSMLCRLLKRLFAAHKTEEPEKTSVIRDVVTDKSRYLPGERPEVSVTLCSEKDASAELTVRATHFAEAVFEETVPVGLTAGEPVTKAVTLTLPETDFTGYAVEAYLRQGEQTVDCAMTAAEVASDWSRFPRYGYLTDYTAKSPEALDAVIDRLNRFHITGLFFYDVMDRHDRPLAGTADHPDAAWQTLARQNASFSSVKGLIDRGHTRGMNAYLYNLLFGALLARAEQLRAQQPGPMKARLYTQVAPENWEMATFFTKAGFKADDSEDLYHFPLPAWPAHPPVTCNYASVALRTPDEVQGFLNRMNAFRITPLDVDFLGQCMQMEHFTAIGYYRGANPVCEALLTGQGSAVTLVSMYVRGDHRRRGFAKSILGAAADILRPRGVTQVSARVFSRSAAQVGLMRAAGATKVRTLLLLPGMYI